MSALGSLVVKLGLEYAEYTGGLSKTEQAALATAKKVQDTFDGMQRKVAATVGAIAGGLAAGFAVGAFRNLLAGVVETGARLDDLRMQTGETVEALSGLLAVGKYNDVGADQLGAMMQKLSSNLAGATEESKGTSKALQALGIDMDAFKRLSPAEQMQQIAQGLAQFEDGAGKSAVAIALLGKEGANALPFFNDLATVGELQAQVTTEQAAAAANLNDNMARLSATGEGWKKELVSGMVPALDLGAQALLDVMNGTGGMREEVKRLAADGSIREWTKNAITGLTYVAGAAEYAWRALKSIGKGFGGLAAGLVLALQGDFRGAFNALKDSGQEMIDAFGGETLGARLRARMTDIEATGQVAEAAKKKLEFRNVIDGNAKAAKEAKNPVDALIESIDKRTTQFAAELSAEEKLTEGEKLAIDVLEQLRSGKVKVTEAEAALIGKRLEALLAVEKEVKANQAAAQALEAERAARAKARQAMEDGAGALLQSNEELEREIELIGLTERQQLQVLRARNEAIILTKRATLAELERRDAISGTMSREQIALAAEIEQLERRNQLLEQRQVRQEEFTAWQSMWQSIDQTAHDVFVNVFEDGAGTFKRLGQTLKASLLDLLYQLTIKQWIINIRANVGGGAGGAALQMASGGGPGLGSLLNLGSSVAGNWGAISGLFSGTMGIANAAGSIAANSIAATGITDGISALLATNGAYGTAAGAAVGGAAAGGAAAGSGGIAGALSAIPGWGWALAGVTASLGSVLGRKVEKRGQGIMGVLGEEGGVHDLDLMRKGGSIVGGPKWFVRDMGVSEMDKALQDTYKQQRDALIDMGKALGLATAGVENFTVQLGSDELGDKKVRGIRLDGLSDQEAQAKIAEALATANNEIAQQIIGSWERTTSEASRGMFGGRRTVEELRYIPSEFARDGERAIDTLTRLATSLTAVNAVFENLGYTLYESSLAGADMASQLVDLFGGMEGFTQATGTFFQNFYSRDEQREAMRRNMQTQLDTLDMDLQLPDINASNAREQFRLLAEAQDRSTEEGRKAWAMLMQLSGAFAQITDTAEDAAEAERERQRVEADARKAATDAAWEVAQASIAAAREAAQAEVELRETRVAATRAVLDVTRAQIRELRGLVPDTAAMAAREAQAFIDRAVQTARAGGGLPDAKALGDAITAARSGMDAGAFTSRLDYEAAQLILANKLEDLQGSGLAQLSVDELLLDTARAEVDRLDTLNKTLREALDEARGTKVAVKDVETAVRDFYAAIVGEQQPGGAQGGGAGAGGADNVEVIGGSEPGAGKTYRIGEKDADGNYTQQVYLGAGHVSYRQTTAEETKHLNEVDSWLNAWRGTGDVAGMLTAAEAEGYRMIDVATIMGWDYGQLVERAKQEGVPRFARGGLHWGGLRLVGEEGPELEVTGTARIYNARQTQQLLQGLQGGGGAGYSDVVRAIEGLSTMLYDALRAIYLKTSDSEKVLRKLDALGLKQREGATV